MTYKYTFLGVAAVAQLLLTPLMENRFPFLIPFLFLILMIAVLATLGLRKSFFWLLLGQAFFGFVFVFAATALQLRSHQAIYFNVAGLDCFVLFLFIAIVCLLMKIFAEKVITSETIKGGISVYFLMGFFWAFLYSLLLVLNHESIFFPWGI